MDRQTRKRLHDAIEAAEEILDITKGPTFQDFVGNLVLKKAVYYDFAVLGEALRQYDKYAPEDTPPLSASRAASDMRNQLIHGYATVDPGVVWSTIEQDLPNLLDELNILLDDRTL